MMSNVAELVATRDRVERLSAELVQVATMLMHAELVEIPSLAERLTNIAIERRMALQNAHRLTMLAPLDPPAREP
jgi:hypothetical protein